MNFCAKKFTNCSQLRKNAPLRSGAARRRKTRVAQEEATRGTYARVRAVLRYSPKRSRPCASCARVSVQGLWRALFRPDTCHAPSEWGGVAVVRPCATNRGWLLAVAKLDGVSDYPNCRSRGSGQPCAPWVSLVLVALSLRLSPSDTNIIPHRGAKVKGFWAEILHKLQAIFGAEFVQVAQASLKRRAPALGATAKSKGCLMQTPFLSWWYHPVASR